jgi:transcriptional regulator with XRE-family HTH domain
MAAGVNRDFVRDILNGKTKQPRAVALMALAEVLGTDIASLTGEGSRQIVRDGTRANHRHLTSLKIVGRAQAGHYLIIGFGGGRKKVVEGEATGPRDDVFPELEQFGYLVNDASMDMICPPGGTAVCVDFARTGRPLREGLYVLVERALAGKAVETSIKVVAPSAGNGSQFELSPSSHDGRFCPFSYPSTDPNETIEVVGLVRYFISPGLPH